MELTDLVIRAGTAPAGTPIEDITWHPVELEEDQDSAHHVLLTIDIGASEVICILIEAPDPFDVLRERIERRANSDEPRPYGV